jgi:hypothetical protein
MRANVSTAPTPPDPSSNGKPAPSPDMGDPAAGLDKATRQFYLDALDVLDGSGLPYCIGGAYALAYHAGVVRHTKDLDVFVRRDDLPHIIAAFEKAGYRTERAHPHWLAKAFSPEVDAFVDMIFRSANGLCPVDEEWLANAARGTVIGRAAPLCPAEEMIWSKGFVMGRERFDGADVIHLLRSRGDQLDWNRLLRRFERYEEVLLGHIVFFRFVYPSERTRVPSWVLDRLINDMRAAPAIGETVCRGTLLSWDQYDIAMCTWNYQDARLPPHGALTEKEVERWTNAPK